MNLISRDTDYALRVILFMAQGQNSAFSARKLSRRLNMPYAFLRRILQKLAKAGVLSSLKGKKGGFIIKQDLAKLTILKVAEVFQGKINLVNCLLQGKPCPQIRICPLRKKLKKIEKEVITALAQESVWSLLKEGGRNGRKNYTAA